MELCRGNFFHLRKSDRNETIGVKNEMSRVTSAKNEPHLLFKWLLVFRWFNNFLEKSWNLSCEVFRCLAYEVTFL